ncbi:hypothetical protein M9B42_02865 [SAR86 cluster bacterium]|nr:hypothetical protein M9B42_02865 [SAR86 cluster bacterium]
MSIIKKLDAFYRDRNFSKPGIRAFKKNLKEIIENTKFNKVKKKILLDVLRAPTSCKWDKKSRLEKYALDKDLYELRIILCLKYGRSSIYQNINPSLALDFELLERTLAKIKYMTHKQKFLIKNMKFPRILNLMLSLIWETASMRVREKIIDHYMLKPEHICLKLSRYPHEKNMAFYGKYCCMYDSTNYDRIPTSFLKKHFNYFKNKYLKIKNYREYYFAPTMFKKDDEVLEVFFKNVKKAVNESSSTLDYPLATDTMEFQEYLKAYHAYWLLKILHDFGDCSGRLDFNNYELIFKCNSFFKQFMTKQKIIEKIEKSMPVLQNLITYQCIYLNDKVLGYDPPDWYKKFPDDLEGIITDLFCSYYDQGILINEIPNAIFFKYPNHQNEAFGTGKQRLAEIKDLAICNKLSINTLSYIAAVSSNPFFRASLLSFIKDKQSTKLIS